MVEGLFYVTRSAAGARGLINGVRAVIVNNDDAETSAQHITAAIAACNAAFPKDGSTGATDPFPAGYFDTVAELSDLAAGPLKDDTDALIFHGHGDIATVGV